MPTDGSHVRCARHWRARIGALAAAMFAADALLMLAPVAVRAQSVVTGSASGRVTEKSGEAIGGAGVLVVNRATGVRASGVTRRDGRYLVQGLEVGGPYSVIVRRIGYIPVVRDGQTITLGKELVLDIVLERQARRMPNIQVMVDESPVMSPERTGTTSFISDSLLRRLPTLNRTFTDFVALTPQVSTAGPGGGLSAAGANARYNTIRIDGATETDLFGLGSTGQPGGQAGGKSITLEAVKEYQVLIAPYDVRLGDFAGLLVNAVTRSGTNDIEGTAFAVQRHGGLSRANEATRAQDFNQIQYGFSVGGPIVRDKVHFFIAPEFQRQRQPARGPYVGGSELPINVADIDRFSSLLKAYGIEPGSAGKVQNDNPLTNLFSRIDVALGDNNRLVLRHNYGSATDDILSRDPSVFRLGSNQFEFTSRKSGTVAQLYSNFAQGGSNELIIGWNQVRDERRAATRAPQISVAVPSASGIGTVTLRAGSENSSQGTLVDQDIFELSDNVTVPIGMHRITIGGRASLYRLKNLFAQNRYGAWDFSSLDSLERGAASRYQVGVALGSDLVTRFDASTFALYAQDEWQATPALSLTAGVRADVPRFSDHPAANVEIARAFGRRTEEIPTGTLQLSPRVGFNWALDATRTRQLRGGAGIFVGPPPYVWLGNAFANSGLGLGQLTCVSGGNAAPPFSGGDPAHAPLACGDGATAASAGDINLIDPSLRFPQHARASLAYDWRFHESWVATIEGLYTRATRSAFYENLALSGPQGIDRHGRVVYGTIATSGIPTPSLVSSRRNVIDLANASGDWSAAITGEIQRQFTNQFEGELAYTYSQARDVQSLTSSVASSNWRFGRAIAGDERSRVLGRSRFETPHRVVAAGTYSASTRTDFSFIYVGQSGMPYEYVYGGALGGGRGDLNADGAVGNDPIYVPRDAHDANELHLSGVSSVPGADNSASAQAARIALQANALQRFIQDTPCLRDQRGRIMERNSCRTPWTNRLDLAIRQALPSVRGQGIAIEADIFNLPNLLNRNWGRQQLLPDQAPIALLDHVGQTAGPLTGTSGSDGIFTFDPSTKRFDANNLASAYQVQLGVRVFFGR